MPKFFHHDEIQIENQLTLTGDNANHIIRSLRGKIGDELIVCDREGVDHLCVIEALTADSVFLSVKESRLPLTEPKVKITLFQALPKNDKMEFVIQKCIELGVYEIVPVITERTIARSKNKLERFQKIAEVSAKQCMRGIIPQVQETLSLQEAIEKSKELDETYVAYENSESSLESFSRTKGNRIGIFIGPEGGFSEREIECLNRENIPCLSLGKRILRSETAGMVAIVLLLSFRGEF